MFYLFLKDFKNLQVFNWVVVEVNSLIFVVVVVAEEEQLISMAVVAEEVFWKFQEEVEHITLSKLLEHCLTYDLFSMIQCK